MKKTDQRQTQANLKILKGGARGAGSSPRSRKNPLFYILPLLALFLLAQILVGWVLGIINDGLAKTTLAVENSLERTLSVSGLITFDEEVISSPRSGYAYYLVEEGYRAPVGAKLAIINSLPPEEFQPDESPVNEEAFVRNPRAGLISFKFDGWEQIGPKSGFLYLTDEEFAERQQDEKHMANGERVSYNAPLLKIINNYTWYFSAIFYGSDGELLAGNDKVNIYFSFAAGPPLTGEQVEVRRDLDVWKITWSINRMAEGFYNQRWSEVKIAYDTITGITIPKSTLIVKDGQKGVYVLEKGLVTFRRVEITGENEDYYLVENLNLYDEVILDPDKAKEGRRF